MDLSTRIRPHLVVVGATAVLGLVAVAALSGVLRRGGAEQGDTAAAPAPAGGAHRAGGPACPTCGTVEAIRTVALAEAGSADAGKDGGKRTAYRITVRMDDGSYRTLSQGTPPSVAVGEKVRIFDGMVVKPVMQDSKG